MEIDRTTPISSDTLVRDTKRETKETIIERTIFLLSKGDKQTHRGKIITPLSSSQIMSNTPKETYYSQSPRIKKGTHQHIYNRKNKRVL